MRSHAAQQLLQHPEYLQVLHDTSVKKPIPIGQTIPHLLIMSRIMYTSQSLNGTIVPVSAFVLWPYAFSVAQEEVHINGAKSHERYPSFHCIAWTQGTSGQFVKCAPSNYRSLQYHLITSYPIALLCLKGSLLSQPTMSGSVSRLCQ
jgi:hypothetical protein